MSEVRDYGVRAEVVGVGSKIARFRAEERELWNLFCIMELLSKPEGVKLEWIADPDYKQRYIDILEKEGTSDAKRAWLAQECSKGDGGE